MAELDNLKPLVMTRSQDALIIAHWVEGQRVYLISDELLKALIDEINELRVLG